MSSSPPSAALDVLADATLVPLTLIDDAPGQPRQQLPDVQDLAANIKAFGLLQPVALRKVGGRYQVIAGHRRIAAYRWLHAHHPSNPQWSAIQAVVTRSSDELAHMAMISGQVHVQPWTDAEVHQVLQRLRSMGMSQADIGRALHRNGAWVSRSIRVHTDPVLAPLVETQALAVAAAEELVRVADVDQRAQMARRAATESWGQSRARTEVRHLKAAYGHAVGPKPAEPAELRELRRLARELLKLIRRVEPDQIPPDALADLWALHDRAESLPQPRRKAAAA